MKMLGVRVIETVIAGSLWKDLLGNGERLRRAYGVSVLILGSGMRMKDGKHEYGCVA